MEFVETEVLKASSIKPIFYFRYVDDIVTVIPKSEVYSFLAQFNSFDPHLKFTLELENDNKLPFLDLLLLRCDDGSIKTDWYHKSTWSGRYLNFNSWLPSSYKNNTVFLLAEKILKLSDQCFHSKNFKILRETLAMNGYPRQIINVNINKAIRKNYLANSIQNSGTSNQQTIFISIPYVKNLFEKINNLLKKFNIKIVGRAYQNLYAILFSKPKDQIPKNLQTNLIYNVKCSCGSQYVGMTKQNLEKRIKQHIHDAGKSPQGSHSALSNHLRCSGHAISLDDTTILDRESNYKKRLLLETIYIKKGQNLLNYQDDSNLLQNYYDEIL